jgi:hypothetical protein
MTDGTPPPLDPALGSEVFVTQQELPPVRQDLSNLFP